MTGTGIHLLDAFVGIAGPVKSVHAQFIERRGGHDPRDTVSVLFELAGGMSGTLGAEWLLNRNLRVSAQGGFQRTRSDGKSGPHGVPVAGLIDAGPVEPWQPPMLFKLTIKNLLVSMGLPGPM